MFMSQPAALLYGNSVQSLMYSFIIKLRSENVQPHKLSLCSCSYVPGTKQSIFMYQSRDSQNIQKNWSPHWFNSPVRDVEVFLHSLGRARHFVWTTWHHNQPGGWIEWTNRKHKAHGCARTCPLCAAHELQNGPLLSAWLSKASFGTRQCGEKCSIH